MVRQQVDRLHIPTPLQERVAVQVITTIQQEALVRLQQDRAVHQVRDLRHINQEARVALVQEVHIHLQEVVLPQEAHTLHHEAAHRVLAQEAHILHREAVLAQEALTHLHEAVLQVQDLQAAALDRVVAAADHQAPDDKHFRCFPSIYIIHQNDLSFVNASKTYLKHCKLVNNSIMKQAITYFLLS